MGIEMTWKQITKALRRFNRLYFLSFFLFFSSLLFSATETALGPIWFGFSMNYHGLDPVSAVKAPKCPSCILILPMNIQQLALVSPLFSHLYWYLTVLVIACWRKMWQREVALIYDPIVAAAIRFNGLKGVSSGLDRDVVEIH